LSLIFKPKKYLSQEMLSFMKTSFLIREGKTLKLTLVKNKISVFLGSRIIYKSVTDNTHTN